MNYSIASAGRLCCIEEGLWLLAPLVIDPVRSDSNNDDSPRGSVCAGAYSGKHLGVRVVVAVGNKMAIL
jgi:hypothetical protein